MVYLTFGDPGWVAVGRKQSCQAATAAVIKGCQAATNEANEVVKVAFSYSNCCFFSKEVKKVGLFTYLLVCFHSVIFPLTMATSTLLHQRSPLDNSPFRMTRNAAMATVQDEAEWVAGHYNSDDGDDAVEVSMRSAASRDTSNTSRTNIDLDNTRQSTTSASRDVSILDLSRHDDDDDEDDDNDDEVGQEVQDTNLECWGADDSIMFEELHVEDGVQEHPSTTENDVDMASRNCRSPTAHISSFPAASPSNETPSSSKEEPGSTSQPSSPGILGMGALSLSSVTDTLVDSICVSSSVVDSTSSLGNLVDLNKGSGTSLSSIAVPVLNCNWNRSTGGDGRSDSCNRNLSPAIADFWQLLGCSTQPSSAELDELWSLRTGGMLHETEQHETAKRPVRSSIKKRLKRLHSLRMLSHGIHGATRHGVTFADQPQNCSFTSIGGSSTASNGTSGLGGGGKARVHSKAFSQPFTLDKAYSMLDDPLADMIGPGMDPILAADDGYDSDPEVNCSNTMDSPAQQQQDHHHQQQARVMFSLASSELDAAIVSSGEEDIEHRHRSQMEAPTNHTSMSHVDPYWLEDQEVRRSVRVRP